jgi:hypothetical protein
VMMMMVVVMGHGACDDRCRKVRGNYSADEKTNTIT